MLEDAHDIKNLSGARQYVGPGCPGRGRPRPSWWPRQRSDPASCPPGMGGSETRVPLMIFDGGGCKSLLIKRITAFSMLGTKSGMIGPTFTFPRESIRASCLTSPALFSALKKPQRKSD